MLSYSSKVSMVSKESSTAVVDSVVESSEVPTAELSSEETKTINSNSLTSTSTATKEKDSSDESEEDNLMKQIKESGVAGVISYAAWELAFWTVSVPVCVLGYKEVTGHWPDLKDKDDISKLGAEAFAFVNFARFAVPLRIGLALSTTPWIQENIVDVFLNDEASKDAEDEKSIKEGTENGGDPDEIVVAESTIDVAESTTDVVEPSTDVAESTKDAVEPMMDIAQSMMDNVEDSSTTGSDDEESIKSERGRFRSRLGNLVNRVLRRQQKE